MIADAKKADRFTFARPAVGVAYWARVIFVLWLAWLLIVVGYQAWVASPAPATATG